jgi:lysophospholipase L1-like esterase
MRPSLALLLGSLAGPRPGQGAAAPDPAGGRGPLRCGALALAVQLALALEVDPLLTGGAAELPGRASVPWAAGSALALVLVLLAWPRLRSAFPALAAGAAVLFLSCPYNAASFHGMQVVLLASAAVAVALAGARGARPARVAVRLALVAVVLLACEGFASTIARTHSVGYTLASRLWFARHWREPRNRLGYRDVEHVEDGRAKLFVLGDSFVAGVGLADVRERFSDRLQAALGQRYQVHNLGSNGADTRQEAYLLETYPFRPDVLVLSYYVNDVLGAAAALGHREPPFRPYANLAPPLAWLVMRSYLLDFVYWLLPQRDQAGIRKHLARCFTWPDVVALHEQDLQHIVDWARERGCAVIAVVFPSLIQLEESAAWIAPALGVFARNGIPAIDVRTLLGDLEPDERIINRNDPHASARVHERVAEALRARVEALGR